jgi:hypothetical protein
MAAGSIVIDLLMRTGSFETDTDRASKKLVKLRKDVEGFAVAAGAAFSGVALAVAAFAKSSIDAADDLQSLSERSGESVEAINGLGYAAEMSGSSMDDMATALRNLNDRLSKAASGDEKLQNLLDALGVKSKTAGEAILELATAFPKLSAADRTRVSMELLGKSGEALVPALSGGRRALEELIAEGQKLRPVTTDLAKAAAQFNDNIDKVSTTLRGSLLPALNDVLPKLNRMIEVFSSKDFLSFSNGLGLNDFDQVTASIKEADANLVALKKSRDAIAGSAANAVPVLRALPFLGVEGDLAALDLQIDAAEKRLGTLRDYAEKSGWVGTQGRSRVADGRGGIVSGQTEPPKTGTDKPTGKSDAQRAAERAIKELADQRDQFQKMLASAQEDLFPVDKYDALRKQAESLYAADLESLNVQLEKIAALEEQDRLTKRLSADAEAMAAVQAEILALTESTLTPFEQYTNQVERLNQLYADGSIDGQLYMRGISQAQDGFDKLAKKSKETTDTMSTFAEQAARNIQDSLAEFLFDPFDKGLDGMLEDFAKMLQRLAAQAAAAEILKSIGNWGSSNSGQEGWVGALAGMVSQFGGQRANGGPVSGGTTYLVGERGPELFRPTSSGAIVPNEALGGGGGDMVVNINNNTSAKVRTEERSQGNTKVLEVTIEEVVARSISQGGKVASAMQGTYQLNRGPGMPRRSA